MAGETLTENMLKRACGAVLAAALAGSSKTDARNAGLASIPLRRLPSGSRPHLMAWFDGLDHAVRSGAEGQPLRILHKRRKAARDFAHLDSGSVRARVHRRVLRRFGGIASAVGCEAPDVACSFRIGSRWTVDVTHSLGDSYSSRCTWRRRHYRCAVEVPISCARALLSKTFRRDIIGGMPTWHGLPEVGDGASVAWWVERGRGYSLNARAGFVARVGDVIAHGATEAKAQAAAAKTYRRLHPTSKAPTLSAGERLQRRIVRLKRHWAVMVGFDDSISAGNCESGTAAWAARFAEGRQEASVRDVLELALTYGVEVERVVAACESAVRRFRQENAHSAGVAEATTSVGEVLASGASVA